MRKYLRSVLIGLTSFLLGMACLFAYFKYSPSASESLLGGDHPRRASPPIASALKLAPAPQDDDDAAQALPPPAATGKHPFPSFFDKDDEDFFGGQDPFAAARKLQQQMEKEMQQGFAGFDGEAGGEEITAKEDDKSVRFEIKGVDGSSLNTSVKNGYLTISGEAKKQNGNFTFESSFQRTLPLPPNVDATKMETISEKDMVVLRFPKKS